MPTLSGFPSGARHCQIWRVADNGAMAGTVGESLGTNTVSGAYLLREVISEAFEFSDPTLLEIRGGDRVVAQEEYGNRKMNPFTMEASLLDAALLAILGGSGTDTDAGEFPAFGTNSQREDWPVCGIAFTQRFQPKATGTDGPRLYHTVIIPSCTIVPAIPGQTYQGEANMTFRITPNAVGTMETGETFADSNMNFEGDLTEHYQRITRSPFHIVAWRANGVATTFTLPYLPLYTSVGNASGRNVEWIDGALTALTSVSSVGLVTIGAAGDSGDHHVVYSQTEFRAA